MAKAAKFQRAAAKVLFHFRREFKLAFKFGTPLSVENRGTPYAERQEVDVQGNDLGEI
jgi:hypothetical protein